MTLQPSNMLRITALVLALAVVLPACEDDSVQPVSPPPAVSGVAVAENTLNSLSTVVSFDVRNTDAARVLYKDPGGIEIATPYYPVGGGSAQIVTLGLADTTTYSHRVEVTGPGGTAMSAPVDFKTGMIPDALNAVRFITTGTPTGGYTITALASTGYVVAFDGDGRIRWYRFIQGMVSRQSLQLENGNYAAFVGTTTGAAEEYGEYVEFKPSGEIVGTHKATFPLYTDSHELLVTVSGGVITHSHLFSYYHKTIDMTAYGGPTDATIAGHQILRIRPDGVIEYTWDAWDYFVIDDWIEEPLGIQTLALADYDHPNSLDIDHDGHYIASWRHLAEVTKINSQTGDIIWRLGGGNNQFTFVNDTFGDFNGQHSAVILENGNLLLYDNGLRHTPPESRAVEYELDTNAMTATQVWEFRHNPAIYTPFVGSVQRLVNGNTVVGFGGAALVTEVDPVGSVVWEGRLTIEGTPTSFYRGRRIRSLYEYERP
jgi:hypothetical protein